VIRLAAFWDPSVTRADTARRFTRFSTLNPALVSFSLSFTFPVAGIVKDLRATTSLRFAEAKAFTVVSLIEPAWPAVPPKLRVNLPLELTLTDFASDARLITRGVLPPGPVPPGVPPGLPPVGVPPAEHRSSDSGPGDASFSAPTL